MQRFGQVADQVRVEGSGYGPSDRQSVGVDVAVCRRPRQRCPLLAQMTMQILQVTAGEGDIEGLCPVRVSKPTRVHSRRDGVETDAINQWEDTTRIRTLDQNVGDCRDSNPSVAEIAEGSDVAKRQQLGVLDPTQFTARFRQVLFA
jgi:hypothetical protein